MRIVRTVARWVFIMAVPVLLVTATLALAFNSLWMYRAGFEKYDVAVELGISDAELERAARDLIAYFNDPGRELYDIEVTYNSGETGLLYDEAAMSHMKDVRGLVWLAYGLFWASALYVLAYILLSVFVWRREGGLPELAWGAKWGGIVTLGLIVFVGVFAFISFDWAFTIFHEIFFPQGNWQFPPDDHMIIMFPDGFWSDVTLLVGLMVVGLGLVVTAAGMVALRKMRNTGG
ncbi:MAG: TIGR01906 family membrane protein [Dehalococcoidia bacterium]|nr:TIGR01906 family membrane protein [Dehalococcoidia bacterium]